MSATAWRTPRPRHVRRRRLRRLRPRRTTPPERRDLRGLAPSAARLPLGADGRGAGRQRVPGRVHERLRPRHALRRPDGVRHRHRVRPAGSGGRPRPVLVTGRDHSDAVGAARRARGADAVRRRRRRVDGGALRRRRDRPRAAGLPDAGSRLRRRRRRGALRAGRGAGRADRRVARRRRRRDRRARLDAVADACRRRRVGDGAVAAPAPGLRRRVGLHGARRDGVRTADRSGARGWRFWT